MHFNYINGSCVQKKWVIVHMLIEEMKLWKKLFEMLMIVNFQQCEDSGIDFACLSKNSTHLTQSFPTVCRETSRLLINVYVQFR